MKYALLASGDGKKVEQFGEYTIERPCAAALWKMKSPPKADAHFAREEKKGWVKTKALPESWKIALNGIMLKIGLTDFGHVGVFPEHASQWEFLSEFVKGEVLNLFAYSGATTLFCAKQGGNVCHVDASKGMVDWARENAFLNELEEKPIRWIVDDVMKFLAREAKRGKKYDTIIFDPPSFGRGSKGQVFKLERDIHSLLGAIRNVLSKDKGCVLFTCHTPGITPLCIENILRDHFGENAEIEAGEMYIQGEREKLPSGTFGRVIKR